MEEVDVSVVVPVYNAVNYLIRCVESIMWNSYFYFRVEVILVDDGSEDGSQHLCDQLRDKYSNIKVRHQSNRGVSNARNAGINMAKGQYIIFVDADDYMEKNGLNLLYQKAVERNSEFVMADVLKVDFNGEKIKRTWEQSDRDYREDEIDAVLLDYLENPRKNNLLSFVWNKLFVTEIIKSHQLLFDEKLKINEDALFVFEYLNYVNSISYIRKYTYCYCTNQDNIGTNHMRENPYAYEKSLQVIYNRLQKNPLLNQVVKEYYYHAFVELAIRNIFHIIRCHKGGRQELYVIIRDMVKHKDLCHGIISYKSENKDNFKVIPLLIRIRQVNLLIWVIQLQIILKKFKLWK